MFRKITVYIICLAISVGNMVHRPAYATESYPLNKLNESEILSSYPDAKVVRVTPEEYLVLKDKLLDKGYHESATVPLKMADNKVTNGEPMIHEKHNGTGSIDDCIKKNDETAGEDSLRVMVDFTEDIMNSSQGSSGDEAAVLFVIVGTVVVVVWMLYVFKYLYDVSMGNAPCGRWKELSIISNSALTSDDQHARFKGLSYAMGFSEGLLDVGINLEMGRADILLNETGTLELKGQYWMLGPMLRWRLSQGINPGYFQMKFSAGTTEHDEVGRLAKASLGLLFGIGDSMQLGLSWGALNINLNGTQGIITERSQYHSLYSVTMGYRF